MIVSEKLESNREFVYSECAFAILDATKPTFKASLPPENRSTRQHGKWAFHKRGHSEKQGHPIAKNFGG